MEMADRPATPWASAIERVVQAGEVLVHEGGNDDDVFTVVEGLFEILRGPELVRIDTVGPGGTIGEIAALAGCPRMATARALEVSLVRQLEGSALQRWLVSNEPAMLAMVDVARSRLDRHRAINLVTELLSIDVTLAAEVVESSERVHLRAGQVLFEEGDASDAGYLVVSGRLAASRDGAVIGEIARGEVVGEVGMIERAPRGATVTALRDSTLARFSVEAFRSLTAAHPTLMLQLSRTILSRVGRRNAHTDRARSIAVAVTVPLDTRLLVTRLAEEIARHGSIEHLWTARIDATLGREGLVESGLSVTQPALLQLLHEAETTHDYLVLELDAADTRWTELALSLADRVVIVSSAEPDAAEQRRLADIVGAAPRRGRLERWLALVHRPDTERAAGGAALADRFKFDRVTHVRSGDLADLNRLARLVSGNATGLVLSGGGARGFAHLGVWRALHELGVEVDAIGGASIGAAMGSLMAIGIPHDKIVGEVVTLFHGLLDYTVPIVSLIKGERISRNITAVARGSDVRDMWLPFFCVSTNLTRSRVEVHDRGDAGTAIRASVAIPGILPPVPFDGELLVDGGVLNNLPCDIMRATGAVHRLIAVDLSPSVGPRAREDFGHAVSGWKALRAQLGPGQSRFPGLMSILMRSLVAGSVRDRDRFIDDGTVDWYLDLDLRGVGLLDFERVEEIATRGHEAAKPRIEAFLAGGHREE